MVAARIRQPTQLFISYARRDAREQALQLCDDLRGTFSVWLDTRNISPGASWGLEIEAEIDRCDVVLALLSPGSYVSNICRGEHLRAIRKGKPVIPLMVQPDADRPVYLESAIYREIWDADRYRQAVAWLLHELPASPTLPRLEVPRAADLPLPRPPVRHMIALPEAIAEIRHRLLQDADEDGVVRTVVLTGLPGSGKTALAVQLCEDPDVIDLFPDGIAWVTMGSRTFESAVETLLTAFGVDGSMPADAPQRLKHLLKERAALIVLDDVWDANQVRGFQFEARRCRVLITSRFRPTAIELGVRAVEPRQMGEVDAITLLRRWSMRDDDHGKVADVARRIGYLPFALKLAGTVMATLGVSASEWLERHAAIRGLSGFGVPDRYSSLPASLELSLQGLSPEQRVLFDTLGVFWQDTPIPGALILRLWQRTRPGIDARAAEDLLARLRALCFVDAAGEGTFTLHDIVLDYAAEGLGDRRSQARRDLIEALRPARGGWSTLLEARDAVADYAAAALVHHLHEAGGRAAVLELLRQHTAGENDWFRVRVRRGETLQYVADLRQGQPSASHDGDTVETLDVGAVEVALGLSSLHSRGSNLPPGVLVAFVARGIWSASRAVEVARSAAQGGERVEGLLALAAVLPSQREALLVEASAQLSKVEPGELEKRLTEAVVLALHAADRTAAAIQLAEARDALTEDLLEQLMPSAADVAGQDAFLRARAHVIMMKCSAVRLLCQLAQEVHDARPELTDAALAEVETLGGGSLGAWAVAPLLGVLEGETRQRYLRAVDEHLVGADTEGIDILEVESVRMFERSLLPRWLNHTPLQAWEAIASHLDSEARTDVVQRRFYEAAPDPSEVGAWAAAAARLDPARRERILDDALEKIAACTDDSSRAKSLRDLAGELDSARRMQVVAGRVPLPLGYCGELLSLIAKGCTDRPLALATWEAAEGLPVDCRAEILAHLSAALSDEERAHALDVTLEAVAEAGSEQAAIDLAQIEAPGEHEVSVGELAVDTILGGVVHSGSSITNLCQMVAEVHVDRIFAAALDHADAAVRRLALDALAPRLTFDQLSQVEAMATKIADSQSVTRTVALVDGFAAKLQAMPADEPLHQALCEVSNDALGFPTNFVLLGVARQLAESGWLEEALDAARRIGAYSPLHECALEAVAPFLPASLARQELELRMRDSSSSGGETPAWSAFRATPVHAGPLLARLPLDERAECVAFLRGMWGRYADVGLAPHVTEDREAVLRNFVEGLEAQILPLECDLLASVAHLLSAGQLDLCIERVAAMRAGGRVQALAALALAAVRPARLDWAMGLLRTFDPDERCDTAASAAVRRMPAAQRDALAKAARFDRRWGRLRSGHDLCKASTIHESPSSRAELLEEVLREHIAALAGTEDDYTLRFISAHACLLPPAQRATLWNQAMAFGAQRFRPQLLVVIRGLRTLMLSLATASELSQVARAIREAGRWWP